MNHLARCSSLLLLVAILGVHQDVSAADQLGDRITLATGLVNPESAVVGFDGRVYLSEIGQRDKDGDGRMAVISGV